MDSTEQAEMLRTQRDTFGIPLRTWVDGTLVLVTKTPFTRLSY